MVYLLHGGFWLALAQLAASAAGFVLTVILANFLVPESLGEYRFLLAGFTMLSIAALPGMRGAVRESTPKGNLGNLRAAFRAMMRFGTLGSLVAVGAALYYYLEGNVGLTAGFIIIALALPFFDASAVYIEYLSALKKFKRATLYTAATRVVLLIIAGGAALLYPTHAWIILAAFLFGQTVPGLIFHRKTRREFEGENPKSDSALTNYAGHLTAMAALGLLAGQLDKFFVWEFIGAAGLATLYVAYVLPQEAQRFLGLAAMLAFPKFAVTDPNVIKQTLLGKIFLYFLGIAVCVFIYILIAPYIFTTLFPQYPDAVIYSQVLMLIALSRAFSPIRTFLTTQKATGSLYILSVLPPAVRIAVAVVFIMPFGIWGAVAALLAEALIRVTLLLILFYRVRT